MQSKLIILAAFFHLAFGKTWLKADESKDTYTLIQSVLGNDTLDVPDCSHKDFGPHITQKYDEIINHTVFQFDIHATPDDDRCTYADRQRNEIKIIKTSPTKLKGLTGEFVSFSWNFHLEHEFRATSDFAHIHQIRTSGGDNSFSPLITISISRIAHCQVLEVLHTDRRGFTTRLGARDLFDFRGYWIHAVEKLTYGDHGKYELTLKKQDNVNGIGKVLLNVSDDYIDLWRPGANYARPIWGIYRGLRDKETHARNEVLLYSHFCFSKGGEHHCV